jgi:hypothetical protein
MAFSEHVVESIGLHLRSDKEEQHEDHESNTLSSQVHTELIA